MEVSAPAVLTQEDIQRLMTDRSVKMQIALAEKLADQYAAQGPHAMSAQQSAIADDIFRLLLSRAGVLVRATLAMQLSQTDRLPRDLARRMAGDVQEVAGPVLQYSEVLEDADLLEIIRSMADESALQSIAGRDSVSAVVSGELVDTHLHSVVHTLVGNEGAHITEASFEKIARHHSADADIVEAVFRRDAVPVSVMEKVIGQLPAALRSRLERKYGNLSEWKAARAALDKSLEAASGKLRTLRSPADLAQLIRGLDERHALAPFSALSLCHLQLFTMALSRLLHIPQANMHTLLQDPAGFKTVYERASLPQSLFPAADVAVRSLRLLAQENPQKSHGAPAGVSEVLERMRSLCGGHEVEGSRHLQAMMQQVNA